MIKHVLSFIVIAFSLAQFAYGGGTCEYSGKAAKGILDFTGKGCSIEGKPVVLAGKVSGEFTVDLTKLDAGVRTEHMLGKYLEVSKFPKAKLVLDPLPEAGGPFTGNFTLHGVTKPIKGTASKSSIGWGFAFDVNYREYGIEKAEKAGVVIGDTISISGTIDR